MWNVDVPDPWWLLAMGGNSRNSEDKHGDDFFVRIKFRGKVRARSIVVFAFLFLGAVPQEQTIDPSVPTDCCPTSVVQPELPSDPKPHKVGKRQTVEVKCHPVPSVGKKVKPSSKCNGPTQRHKPLKRRVRR